MKTTIIGSFKDLIRRRSDDPEIDAEIEREPIEGAVLELRLSHDAVTPDGAPAEGLIEISLTTDAAIPAGTQVWANDKLRPRGTHYVATVYEPFSGHVFGENLAIVGDGIVDLRRLTPLGAYPPEPEGAPEPVAPPLPAKRVRGANYLGFMPFNIYGATRTAGSTGIDRDSGRFYLPFPAVVRTASIIVDVPQIDRSVLIELYSVDTNKKVCAVSIDAARSGPARSYFDKTVVLPRGEYSVRWNINRQSSQLKLRSIGDSDIPQIRFSV